MSSAWIAPFRFPDREIIGSYSPTVSKEGFGVERFLEEVERCVAIHRTFTEIGGPYLPSGGQLTLARDNSEHSVRLKRVQKAIIELGRCMDYAEAKLAFGLDIVRFDQLRSLVRRAESDAKSELSALKPRGRPRKRGFDLLVSLAVVWERFGGGRVSNKNNRFSSFVREVSAQALIDIPLSEKSVRRVAALVASRT